MAVTISHIADFGQRIKARPTESTPTHQPPVEDIKAGKASWMHWRLVSMISDFESELTDDQEVAVEIAGRPTDALFYLENIAFWNPDMIVLYGSNSDGAPQRFTHHVSEMGYLLVAAPKIHDTALRIRDALEAGLSD